MVHGLRSRVWLGLAIFLAACSPPAGYPRAAPDPAASAPVVSPTASTPAGDDDAPLPPPPPIGAAGPVAAGFAAAWVNASADPVQWLAGVRPWCDDALADALRSTDPTNVPARRLLGPPRQVGGSAEEGLRFEVPTDAGTLLLTIAAIAGRWCVSQVDFARSAS